MQPQQPEQPQPQAPTPQPQSYPTGVAYPAPPAAAPQPHEYEFIVNPQKPSRMQSLPGKNDVIKRVLVVAGGLLVLLILFSIVKGLLGGNSNLPLFLGVAQDQQELIHLSTSAIEQKELTTTNQNFAITAQLGLTSDRTRTLTYMAGNGMKVDAKKVNLKIDPALDAKLTAAAAASTYDATFKQIMQTKLANYKLALQQTYKQTTGKNGRALLNQEYSSADLLLKQLNADAQ